MSGFVNTIFEMNPGCFDSPSEVQCYLRKMLWPPQNVEDLSYDFPHIPRIATDLRVQEDREWIPVLEAELPRYLEITAARACFKIAFIEQFGTIERFRNVKREFIAEGGTAEQFDEMCRSTAERAEKELKRPWWKFW